MASTLRRVPRARLRSIVALMSTLDGKGTVAVFVSSLSWDEIINGRQEAPAKSHGWLYAAGGAAALLLVILLYAKRRKKDEDDED